MLRLDKLDGMGRRNVMWQTLEDGKPIEYHTEPAVTHWQRLKVDMYSFLPLYELL